MPNNHLSAKSSSSEQHPLKGRPRSENYPKDPKHLGERQGTVLEYLLENPGQRSNEIHAKIDSGSRTNLWGMLARGHLISEKTGHLHRFYHPLAVPETDCDPLKQFGVMAIRRLPIKPYHQNLTWLRSRGTFLPVRFYEQHVKTAPGEVGVYEGVRWTAENEDE